MSKPEVRGEWPTLEPANYGNTPWRDISTAPKNGVIVRLKVIFEDHALEDCGDPMPTIGVNCFDNTGVDKWLFAGWDWSHDRFTQGTGRPIGWLPMLDTEQTEVCLRYDGLHRYAEANRLQYNELCSVVRAAIAYQASGQLPADAESMTHKVDAAMAATRDIVSSISRSLCELIIRAAESAKKEV